MNCKHNYPNLEEIDEFDPFWVTGTNNKDNDTIPNKDDPALVPQEQTDEETKPFNNSAYSKI